jgi:hypothetical protein
MAAGIAGGDGLEKRGAHPFCPVERARERSSQEKSSTRPSPKTAAKRDSRTPWAAAGPPLRNIRTAAAPADRPGSKSVAIIKAPGAIPE